MSVEAQESRHVLDELNPLVGAANLWDYLPALRWFDVFGVKRKMLTAVNRRNASMRRLIDAERQRMDNDVDGGDGEKKSMISVLLTLQKTEPEVYTDTMIMTLCAIVWRRNRDYNNHNRMGNVASTKPSGDTKESTSRIRCVR
ncbi:hypothetical protein E2562_036542 [Oryza meyeriana var. granulata]|uniref:Uncharacterized protein n=1 Tax=Oryza meyeriana var. granulata TaxID=110450 RepID=A0A6G1DV16_9ORYZ|nr:hypothetical protein E2562_036542 [Oryza meyeriana var. granulata]